MNDDQPIALPRSSPVRVDHTSGVEARERLHPLIPLLLAVAAFVVYWRSAVILDARGAKAMFGADSPHYEYLRQSLINDRAARFHPLTIVLGLGWMKLLAPVTAWMTPAVLLNGLLALVGAVGVWASTVTCATLLPQRLALLAGVLYAVSLGVWYFAAIEESKIVTATLVVLYIAAYVRMRDRWTLGAAIGLSLILAMACLNEIVSAGLVAIPLVDAMARRGFDARREPWIAVHAMVVPAVWFFLEVFVNGRLIPETVHVEGQSHYNMLLYYLAKNDYGLASLYSFVLNWFLFNIAAPTPTAPLWAEFGGYFAPAFTNYFRSLPTIGVVVSLAVVAVASLLPRARGLGSAGPLLLALAAYAFVRAAFFFFFNPAEPMLFSPAVTLVHWLILLVPFAASRFPAKEVVLAVLALCLIATNAGLILGREVFPLVAWR